MYGTEYRGSATTSVLFGHVVDLHNVPCAVCRSVRATAMMLPGRDECYPGWTLEYPGYLMAGNNGHVAATEYACVDGDPETEAGDFRNDAGALFYPVEGICGSLPCPPYINGRELTCSVCTKWDVLQRFCDLHKWVDQNSVSLICQDNVLVYTSYTTHIVVQSIVEYGLGSNIAFTVTIRNIVLPPVMHFARLWTHPLTFPLAKYIPCFVGSSYPNWHIHWYLIMQRQSKITG
jgi:hypothetical protein